MPPDPRIVFGATCAWWGSIGEVGTSPRGLPACPHCGGVLFEIPDEVTWWAGVDAQEAAGDPGYRAFIEWLRGSCFPSVEHARCNYVLELMRAARLRLRSGDVAVPVVERARGPAHAAIDRDGIIYAAEIIAVNYIWQADEPDRPGRRTSVSQTIAGTAVHAYLTHVAGRR